MTEPEDDEDLGLVDPYLASAMGLDAGSPTPPSAYVGTIPYVVDGGSGNPVPSEPVTALPGYGNANEVDLVRALAEIEHLAIE